MNFSNSSSNKNFVFLTSSGNTVVIYVSYIQVIFSVSFIFFSKNGLIPVDWTICINCSNSFIEQVDYVISSIHIKGSFNLLNLFTTLVLITSSCLCPIRNQSSKVTISGYSFLFF